MPTKLVVNRFEHEVMRKLQQDINKMAQISAATQVHNYMLIHSV